MSTFQKVLLWGSGVLTGGTGLVYWWMDQMITPTEEWSVINHPLQPWMLKAHILVAPVLVFAVGLIAMDHIWPHFRRRVLARRRSGIVTLVVLLPMVLSGYLIQAVTHESFLGLLAWIHLGTGVVYLLGLTAHSLVLKVRPRR